MENRRKRSSLASIPSVCLYAVPVFLLFLIPNVKSLGVAVEWASGAFPAAGRNEVGGWPIAAGLNLVSVQRSFTEQGLYSLRLQLPAMPLLQFLLPLNRAVVYYSLVQGVNVVVGVTLAVWLAWFVSRLVRWLLQFVRRPRKWSIRSLLVVTFLVAVLFSFHSLAQALLVSFEFKLRRRGAVEEVAGAILWGVSLAIVSAWLYRMLRRFGARWKPMGLVRRSV